MFFLLRCFLFLGLVFWSIPPKIPAGAPSVAAQARARVEAPLASAVRFSRARADAFCNDRPALCLEAASRLASAGKDISSGQVLQLARSLADKRAM